MVVDRCAQGCGHQSLPTCPLVHRMLLNARKPPVRMGKVMAVADALSLAWRRSAKCSHVSHAMMRRRG
eukprot:CAMPEP_0185185724 /NCGR_PEP_ID=MMETSP1140-20130426/3521_1 /TAXON_ID=298111 /ORGANISM="Pavlova sp., Strain CCMP459" /LENGTH=67 /DNA_ID=CAMNT_0027751937 /DNA_START=185 /DNA_END=385 /DNA_ORIENTATION=-